MGCAVCDRLSEEVENRGRLYAKALTVLNALATRADPTDRASALEMADKARSEYETARSELASHQGEHGEEGVANASQG